MLSKTVVIFLALPIALATDSDATDTVVPAPSFIGAWRKNPGTGAPLPCPETKALHDVLDAANPWPGKCENLLGNGTSTKEECEARCAGNPECSVWQYTAGDVPNQCYVGVPGNFAENCFSRSGDAAMVPAGGQRIQHGDVRVISTTAPATTWIDGLHNTGISGMVNGTTDKDRCRDVCYSDIHCRYWQYGQGGCWVENSAKHVGDAPIITNSSDAAKTVVGGEIIEHYCESHLPPKKSLLPYIIGAIVGVLVLAILAALCCKSKAPPKEKRTRAVKLAAPKEKVPLVQAAPLAPMPMQLMPMPMPIQSYSMLPMQQPMMQSVIIR